MATLLARPGLEALVDRQCRVVTRAQLRGHGIGAAAVRAAVAAERWSLVGDSVVLLQTGVPTRVQSWWIGVLHAADWTGGTAGLAAWTALEADGLHGFESPPTHVVVRRGAHVPELPGLKVHESRRLELSDLHPNRTPTRTRTERSAVDAAVWTPNVRHACAVMAAVVQQRLSTAERITECLENAGKVRHRRYLLATLTDIAGGAHSLAELDVGRVCRRAGLVAPARQRVRRDQNGRKRYVDCEWVLPDGRVVVLEVDGSQHMEVEQWWADMPRQRGVTGWGRLVLRCAAIELRVTPQAVAADLAAAGVPRCR